MKSFKDFIAFAKGFNPSTKIDKSREKKLRDTYKDIQQIMSVDQPHQNEKKVLFSEVKKDEIFRAFGHDFVKKSDEVGTYLGTRINKKIAKDQPVIINWNK